MTKRKIFSFVLVISFLASSVFAEDQAKTTENDDDKPIQSVLVGGAVPGTSGDDEVVKQGLVGDLTVGAGIVGLDNRSFKFGEYTGLTDKNQGFAVGDMDLSYNRDFYYADLQAENLGLDNRKVYFEAGKYNDYAFTAGFNQTPHFVNNVSQTPFNGIGGTSLTLPSDFGKASTSRLVAIRSVNNVDLQDTRDASTFGFSKNIGEQEYNVKFMRETKSGIRTRGAAMSFQSIVLPEAFDQVVSEAQASAAYNGEKSQLRFDYFMSLYDNQNKSMTWESPYTGVASSGLISQAPSSQYHKLSLNGGINLPYLTRLTAIAEYGLATQNEDLFPYGFGTSTSLLPRTTADAKIQTAHLTINGSSRPFQDTFLKDLFLTAKYRHHQVINDTPINLYTPIRTDTGAPVAVNSAQASYNYPFAYTQDQVRLDASYPVFKATYVNLGYDADLMRRKYREVAETLENTLHAGFRSNYFERASGNVNFHYGNKIGDRYDESRMYNFTHPAGAVTSFPFDNLPDMRRFDIANRERKKVATNFSFFPTDELTFGVNYNYMVDDYNQATFGLRHQNSQDVTGDINYSPNPSLNLFLFYTYENGVADQYSRSYSPTILNSELSETRNWSVNSDNIFHTIGVGSKAFFLRKKLSLDTKYTYSEGTSQTNFAAGSALGSIGGVPDMITQRHRVEAKGKYHYSPEISFGVDYIYENYRFVDFATDQMVAASSTINNVVLLSNMIPSYEGHIGFVSATYHFGAPKSSGQEPSQK